MGVFFLTTEAVLCIHAKQIARFGGSGGLRDRGLLESAVGMPQQTFDGQHLYEDVAAMAAVYLYHIAKNHPFEDGNKRTGFVAAETFLTINGYQLLLSDEEGYDLVVAVVEESLSKPDLIQKVRSAIVPMVDTD
jgi:death-on-curing protein